MKHSNLAVFIPHTGCPGTCSFCNQHVIADTRKAPSAGEVDRQLAQAVSGLKNNPAETEIAFFGGSFTAMEPEYMLALLNIADGYVKRFSLKGIRFSTRPDAVSPAVMELLSRYPVSAVELGAQSMDDAVLQLNRRGHTAQQVREACRRVREAGYELGLQMMVGLYGATVRSDLATADEFISLSPDTVRIYPTVILPGTALADYYAQGKYIPYPLTDAVDLCAGIMKRLMRNGIRIIKVGLHASEELAKEQIAGIYHPAFRELCESRIYYDSACQVIAGALPVPEKLTLLVNQRAVSKMVGQKKENIRKLSEQFQAEIKVRGNTFLPEFQVSVLKE